MTKRALEQNILSLVSQVVALAQPQRIILFGSAARGEWRKDNDLDLLVVVPEKAPRKAILDRLNTQLDRRNFPCDVLLTTPSRLARFSRQPGLIYYEILREGREVYAA
jgi:predicted nucleotidyltransferase